MGGLINVYFGVLDLANWGWTNTAGLIALIGYAAIGVFIGVRWFRWGTH